VRPIEKYWALCKVEYRDRKTPPKSLISFKRIWRNISKNVTERSEKSSNGRTKEEVKTSKR
jgi:hypothetical protein